MSKKPIIEATRKYAANAEMVSNAPWAGASSLSDQQSENTEVLEKKIREAIVGVNVSEKVQAFRQRVLEKQQLTRSPTQADALSAE